MLECEQSQTKCKMLPKVSFALWSISNVLMCTNGALSIVIIVKTNGFDDTNNNISLVLFTIFEWISAISSFINLIQISNNLKKNNDYKNRIKVSTIFNIFTMIGSIIIWIYWIDSIIFRYNKILINQNLYTRQLLLSFTTIFIISIIFKSFSILQLVKYFHSDFNNSPRLNTDSDLESNDQLNIKNSPFTSTTMTFSNGSNKHKSNIVKIKESVQTLVSKSSFSSNNSLQTNRKFLKDENKENNFKHSNQNNNHNIINNENNTINMNTIKHTSNPNLDIKLAKLQNIPTETTTDNTDPNLTNPILQNLSQQPNLKLKESQILDFDCSNINSDIDYDLSIYSGNNYKNNQNNPYKFNHFNSNFIFENNDDLNEQNIQMLNISEPLNSKNLNDKQFKQSYELNNDNHNNNTLFTIYNDNEIFFEKDENPLMSSPKTPKNSNSFTNDVKSFSDSNDNCFLDDLNKEIVENRNDSWKHELLLKQSMPNLRVNNQINEFNSLSKKIKNSISTSNLNFSNNKYGQEFINNHYKSSSLSTISYSYSNSNLNSNLNLNKSKKRSKSHSPLKKLKHFKDSLQLTPKEIKDIKINNDLNNEIFELDLNLANSIRNSPIKRKQSIKSLKNKSRSDNLKFNSISKSPILSPSNSIKNSIQSLSPLADKIIVNNNNNSNIFMVATNKLGNEIQNKLLDPIDNYIINYQKNRIVSNTDKSSITNNSVPSDYYGEYDKEKWRTFKKVKENLYSSNISITANDIHHLSTYDSNSP